jgi:hypothetical protein
LQTQYARDFTFVRLAKGKNNFCCEVKDDFIKKVVLVCNLAAIIHRLIMDHV